MPEQADFYCSEKKEPKEVDLASHTFRQQHGSIFLLLDDSCHTNEASRDKSHWKADQTDEKSGHAWALNEIDFQ